MTAIANLPSRGEPNAQAGDPKPIATVIADVLAHYGLEGTISARAKHTPIRMLQARWKPPKSAGRSDAGADCPSADPLVMRLAAVP